ncbi:BrnA antitoxin family protein [Massilia solisilvae]|uniref:BrnA antitoxin family protein n=1 Tax=Massilia solisilvae TaxID=1811225 RepID=A0ABT2BGI0_9BURK|nr:BrnA antitoxin family protein [Massilia solisilvae]MCS0607008.1 BrnA antitoxin family protein [Massilia solisilvae]
MPKLKPGTILPTPDEDAAITAAAKSDADAMPYSDEEWEDVKPTVKRGRPAASASKERVTIRLSPEVVQAFRATGAGWQTRVDAALQDWLKTHSPE